MINAQTTARRRSAPPDATVSLRWDEAAKRWEVTLTNRRGTVLASTKADTTVPLDRVTAAVCVGALRDALLGLLPW